MDHNRTTVRRTLEAMNDSRQLARDVCLSAKCTSKGLGSWKVAFGTLPRKGQKLTRNEHRIYPPGEPATPIELDPTLELQGLFS